LINRKDDLSSFLLGSLIERETEEHSRMQKPLPVVICNKILEICERYLEAVSVFDSLSLFSDEPTKQEGALSPANDTESVIDLTESGDESPSPTPKSSVSSPLEDFILQPSQVTTLLLRPYSAHCSAQLSAGKSNDKDKSKDKGTAKTTKGDHHPVLSLLSVFTLGASVCFRAYLQECSSSAAAAVSASALKTRPPFMSELNAGTVLATLCWDGVDLLEKESRSVQSILKTSSSSSQSPVSFSNQLDFFPPYATPIQVLSLLMTPVGDHYFTSRYCHRRSGRYYERLCIDLEQIGLWRQALIECCQALQDPFVKGSFVIGLTRRYARLKQKELKANEEISIPLVDRPLPSLQAILKVWCGTVGIDKGGERGYMLLTAQQTLSEVQKKKKENRTSVSLSSSTPCFPLSKPQDSDKKKTPLKPQQRSSSVSTTFAHEGWTCQSCTFLNSSRTWKCDICRTDRVQFPLRSPPESPQEETHPSETAVAIKRSMSEPQSQNKRSKFHHSSPPSPPSPLASIPSVLDLCETDESPSLLPTQTLSLSSPLSISESSVAISVTSSGLATGSGSVGSQSQAITAPVTTEALMSDEEIDRVFFNLQEPSHLYSPPVVVMVGRRVGDMRMGKNLLIGPTGNAVSVESLVMEVMKLDYEEGLLYEPLSPASASASASASEERKERGKAKGRGVDKSDVSSSGISGSGCGSGELVMTTRYQHLCGNWIGWHCEGSILRSLFPLLLWEEIFDISVPDVFQTKYQEAPLDLHADHGLFYLNRSLPPPLLPLPSPLSSAAAAAAAAAAEQHKLIRN
jgi:hypothetical protein